jgi:hypothetical protein
MKFKNFASDDLITDESLSHITSLVFQKIIFLFKVDVKSQAVLARVRGQSDYRNLHYVEQFTRAAPGKMPFTIIVGTRSPEAVYICSWAIYKHSNTHEQFLT